MRRRIEPLPRTTWAELPSHHIGDLRILQQFLAIAVASSSTSFFEGNVILLDRVFFIHLGPSGA
jgi:hypothetical protein